MYWINPKCFVNPATDPANLNPKTSPWYFGTSGFDILNGPGIDNWDTGVHKNFQIHESMNFTVRGEFFNTWNHPHFANPNSGVTGGTFGTITATNSGIGRIAQIGANLSF
jgi:hypothetical protein